MKPKILIVDDEERAVRGIKKLLDIAGNYRVDIAFNGKEALKKVEEDTFNVVITDYKMPEMNGLELLEKIKKDYPEVEVIVITAYDNEVGPAVEAMKIGAFDYITKPIQTTELKIQIKKALERQKLRAERSLFQEELNKKYGLQNIIGNSTAMQKVYEKIRLVAPTNATVLITGESGTGKELVAEAIHRLSPRKENPLIKVHCAALPMTLLESELFGHVKGAFTGAVNSKPGRFEMADKSSLFLDEISEIEPFIQVKLLRVLQDQIIERVGGTESMQVDVRIICATNQNLEELVQKNKFREDLFYRLKVVDINLPPLREREGDVPVLIKHFVDHFSRLHNKGIEGVSPGALKVLYQYPWPGNVRQLRNTIESMVVLSRSKVIQKKDLPEELFPEKREEYLRLPLGLSINEVEKEYILANLRKNNFNKAQTAKDLGIGRKTLYRKLDEYQLETLVPGEEDNIKQKKK